MPSSYRVVLWKQDSFLILGQLHWGVTIWRRRCEQVYANARHA